MKIYPKISPGIVGEEMDKIIKNSEGIEIQFFDENGITSEFNFEDEIRKRKKEYPNLKEIIEIARYYLPNSRIVIVTNGLLLDKLSPEILKAIYDNNIIITISLYEPTFKRMNNILEVLNKYNIKYWIHCHMCIKQ